MRQQVDPQTGTMASSWMQSTPPSVNFKLGIEGRYVASPGSTRVITAQEMAAAAAAAKAKADAAAAAAAKAADTSVSVPKVGQIYISEVMFAGGGTLHSGLRSPRFSFRAGESEWLDADGRECDC